MFAKVARWLQSWSQAVTQVSWRSASPPTLRAGDAASTINPCIVCVNTPHHHPLPTHSSEHDRRDLVRRALLSSTRAPTNQPHGRQQRLEVSRSTSADPPGAAGTAAEHTRQPAPRSEAGRARVRGSQRRARTRNARAQAARRSGQPAMGWISFLVTQTVITSITLGAMKRQGLIQ
jgi:hypothetical protein